MKGVGSQEYEQKSGFRVPRNTGESLTTPVYSLPVYSLLFRDRADCSASRVRDAKCLPHKRKLSNRSAARKDRKGQRAAEPQPKGSKPTSRRRVEHQGDPKAARSSIIRTFSE